MLTIFCGRVLFPELHCTREKSMGFLHRLASSARTTAMIYASQCVAQTNPPSAQPRLPLQKPDATPATRPK